jgi:hypothetical protein
MATAGEVLTMLIPDGGWIVTGNDYEGIEFLSCDPITKKQFTDGFAKFENAKIANETKRISDREALLNKLGITADEATLLLS